MVYEYRPLEHHFTWLPSVNNLQPISRGVLSVLFEKAERADTEQKGHEVRKGTVVGKLMSQNWRQITPVISIYVKKSVGRKIATIWSVVVWALWDLEINHGHESAGKWYYAEVSPLHTGFRISVCFLKIITKLKH